MLMISDPRSEIDEGNDTSGFFYERNVGNVYTVRPVRLGAQAPYESNIINIVGPNNQCFDEYFNHVDEFYGMK